MIPRLQHQYPEYYWSDYYWSKCYLDLCWKASRPHMKYVPSNGESGSAWNLRDHGVTTVWISRGFCIVRCYLLCKYSQVVEYLTWAKGSSTSISHNCLSCISYAICGSQFCPGRLFRESRLYNYSGFQVWI